jgi:hypothetical protein
MHNVYKFEAFPPSAGMVGKQGVAAPVLVAASGTAVLYMLAVASLCNECQPPIIYVHLMHDILFASVRQGMCATSSHGCCSCLLLVMLKIMIGEPDGTFQPAC